MVFSAEWLAMREPLDHVSRDAGLLANVVSYAGANAVVVDLGSGTGSTARAFNDPVCATWTWHFIDGNQDLLNISKTRHPRSVQSVMDLKDIDKLPLDHVDLVTASALLDLMPHAWVAKLARRLQKASIAFYSAINYNGNMRWTPPHHDDQSITDAFNRHQRTDKGVGPALGPASGTVAANIFAEHGFDVSLADSPWELSPDRADLHLSLINGIGDAAAECGHSLAIDWIKARSAMAAKSIGYIGHTDLLAVPQIR